MKLDPAKDRYDQDWWWVAHEDGLDRNNPRSVELVKRRYEIEIIGGVVDQEASYSYDEMALCKLGNDYYLLSTSGCSCPSPSETWGIEIGPTTLSEIKQHIQSGNYQGYTLPKKQESEFLALIEEAMRSQ